VNVSAQFDSKARGQLNIMFLSWVNVSAQFDSKARVLLTITLLEDSAEKAENMVQPGPDTRSDAYSPNTCNSSDVFRVHVAKACSFTGSSCSIDHGLSCGHLLT